MKKILKICLVILMPSAIGCEEFIRVDPPRTELVNEAVFSSPLTAKAALIDVYNQLRSSGFASGSVNSITFLTTLLSDEQKRFYESSPALTSDIQQFNDNTLTANNFYVAGLWSDIYSCIYKVNSIIEGLEKADISESVKNQLAGEAKFIRAFCYFYLVNLWGDVPLVITTDYRENGNVARTPLADVYSQMILDLKFGQQVLPADFSVSSSERVRANQGTCTALLARVYLYTGQWSFAEQEATKIISNSSLYSLSPIKDIFLKNNKEAIFQFWSDQTANDFFTFYLASSPLYGALNKTFADGFEAGDLRKVNWVGTFGVNLFARKYSSLTRGEYSTVLRVSEQYLIRAEARIRQDKLTEAQSDLNVIRKRAGLSDLTGSVKVTLENALVKERRAELFCEWGHRWLDLRRTNIQTVLGPLKPGWKETASLLPIPEVQLMNDLAMRDSQNPGY